MTHMNRANGFTLLELLVVLAVSSILLTMGVPSFRAVVLDSRLVSETNQFVSAVNLARSAAVQYQRDAVICTSATDWTDGWIVWVDKDRDAATDADEIIAVREPLSDTTAFDSGATDRFSYDSRGFGLSGADTLTVCDSRQNETGRQVRVNAIGRTNVAPIDCS